MEVTWLEQCSRGLTPECGLEHPGDKCPVQGSADAQAELWREAICEEQSEPGAGT